MVNQWTMDRFFEGRQLISVNPGKGSGFLLATPVAQQPAQIGQLINVINGKLLHYYYHEQHHHQ